MPQPDPAGPMPDVLASLADLLAGQLESAATELRRGTLTAWQCCSTAAILHELQRGVSKLRRDVNRLSTEDTSR